MIKHIIPAAFAIRFKRFIIKSSFLPKWVDYRMNEICDLRFAQYKQNSFIYDRVFNRTVKIPY